MNPAISDPIRCPVTNDQVKDCGTQFPIPSQGTSTLRPERSVSSTLGFVLEPASSVSIAMDAFRIRLSDQINNGINPGVILQDAASLAKYANLVQRGAVDPNFPNLPGQIILIDQSNLNIGQVRLTGVDFDTKFRIPAGDIGKFTIGYSGTYFISYEAQNPDGSFTPAINQVNGATGGVIPRLKTYLSVSLNRGPWTITGAYNWQRGYDHLGNSPFFDLPTRHVGTYESFDAQVQFTGLKNQTLTLGARNIFNRIPPYTNAGGQTSFQSGYDPQYADPRGRFMYLNLSYAFR